MHSEHTQPVGTVGPFRISSTLKTFFGVCAVIGIVTFVAALKVSPERAWPNFLLNYFYFLLLGLSGAFFTALQHVTNAYWSVTVRRLAESLISYLPVAAVLGIVLFLGRHHLYEWTHAEAVGADALLKIKSGYLNSTSFGLRLAFFSLAWIVLAYTLRKNSLEQDKTGDPRLTIANVRLSVAFIPIFAVAMSLTAVDTVMSLEPHWFSTMFGVYCFSGLFFSGLALLAVLMCYGRRQGLFTDNIINANHLHDMGKLLFGFTVFWGYIMFDQLMLQWYANLPEETPYYIRRFHGGWWPFACTLFTAHFVIPFFGLLPREAKRNDKYLMLMGLFCLFAQWLDAYIMVMPPFFKEGPVFGWIEVGTALGFLGLFGISVGRFLEKVPAIPIRDPRLVECLAHSQ